MSTSEKTEASETFAWVYDLPLGRTGSDRERRAANAIAGRLRDQGRGVAVEPIYVHPQWPAIHLLHCLLAIAGSLLAVVSPVAGFVLVFVAATSLYLDLTGRHYLLRRIFFRRASQNLISPPITDEPAPTAFICAHYDTALSGAAYDLRARRTFELFRRIWPARTSPQAVVFWSIALLLPALGLRLAGVDAGWIALLQLPQSLILIVAAFVIGEIGLSRPSPGANDNAAGVAAALLAAVGLEDERPKNVEVRLLLCGGGQTTRQGARSFIRENRGRLDRDQTWFIDISSPGVGEPRFVTREVPALSQGLDPTLRELAEALAEGSDQGLAKLDLGPAGSASLFAGYGYPAIALTARQGAEFTPTLHHTPADRPETVDPDAIGAVAATAEALVRLLDRSVARERRSGGL